jgi:hypothetical protein
MCYAKGQANQRPGLTLILIKKGPPLQDAFWNVCRRKSYVT